MTNFELVVLGSNSAVPSLRSISSSFVLIYGHEQILIDCGEGAQIKMIEYGIKPSRINHILITHLHGDHIFGLPGLLTSMSLNGRQDAIHIYGPKGIKNFIESSIGATGNHLSYSLIFKELLDQERQEVGPIGNHLMVSAFPLVHRIPTFGYRIDEVIDELNIIPEKIKEFQLSIEEIKAAKRGENIVRGDYTIEAKDLTFQRLEERSYAHCSDTAFSPDIIPHIEAVNLLYHEATFLDDADERAELYAHSTARQAAQIAKDSQVDQLILGHFSSRYEDLSRFVTEASNVFPNTHLALPGTHFDIR